MVHSGYAGVHRLIVNFFTAKSNRIRRSRSTILTENHPVTIESFIPEDGSAHPAVIALHGSGGIREGWAEQPASLLASQGFAVFVLHYFERTGTVWASDGTIRQHFPVWMKTVSDAITHVAADPQVDGRRVALLGFSLGGYLAVSVATQDRRVKAVVEYFGGLPEELSRDLVAMPPVLILHGDRDSVVPVAEAHQLASRLKTAGTEHDVKIYPHAGHGFGGLDLLDAGQRTLSFLRKHLNGQEPAT